jgi:hypothetical protein
MAIMLLFSKKCEKFSFENYAVELIITNIPSNYTIDAVRDLFNSYTTFILNIRFLTEIKKQQKNEKTAILLLNSAKAASDIITNMNGLIFGHKKQLNPLSIQYNRTEPCGFTYILVINIHFIYCFYNIHFRWFL